MSPDMWLTYVTKKRKERIRKSLPDAIDLLVICVDAGLGLDQALLRVGEELALSHPDINEEFTQVNLEQRAGKPRLEAWQSLADRTKIEEFAAFTSMLTQTDRFGTPIIKSLSRFSEEMRMKRRQHAEEMAAKTKIKIIFPLVLFIFPCIFIVLLAPALLSISKGMQGLGELMMSTLKRFVARSYATAPELCATMLSPDFGTSIERRPTSWTQLSWFALSPVFWRLQ